MDATIDPIVLGSIFNYGATPVAPPIRESKRQHAARTMRLRRLRVNVNHRYAIALGRFQHGFDGAMYGRVPIRYSRLTE